MTVYKRLTRSVSIWFASLIFACTLLVIFPCAVKADQIKSADVFAGAQWNYVTEWKVKERVHNVQSMCETDRYIVCYEDTKERGKPDVITVFDRFSYDLLFKVSEVDYEHGNGMTYNSKTNEVYIAPYNSVRKKNKGAVFVLDGDTLKFKRRVYISDGSWNAASIEYVDGSDQYIIQSTRQKNYTFYLYDAEFNRIDTLFEGDQSMGNLFQDFCVSGDLLISVPWMRKDMREAKLQFYSISQKTYLGAYDVHLPGAGEVYELESICQSDLGEIVVVVSLSGTQRMALYNTYVPVIYTVSTKAENGQITPTRGDVDMGSNYRVKYSSAQDYELNQLWVDGQELDANQYPEEYVFGNIQDDHSIWVQFTEIPKFQISTGATNGTIDESLVVRRDEDVTIHYDPERHYEVDRVMVDGKAVDSGKYEDSYTFKSVQEPHSIEVFYKEVPSFAITTKVHNGSITATNEKVYGDEKYTVSYRPDAQYQMAYMRVDGRWLEKMGAGTSEDKYVFENIQKGHSVEVFYQWKYLPLVVLAGAFGACIPMGLIYLCVSRVRSRRKYRNKKNAQS